MKRKQGSKHYKFRFVILKENTPSKNKVQNHNWQPCNGG